MDGLSQRQRSEHLYSLVSSGPPKVKDRVECGLPAQVQMYTKRLSLPIPRGFRSSWAVSEVLQMQSSDRFSNLKEPVSNLHFLRVDGYNLRVLISLRQLNFSELSHHPALNPRRLPIEESIDEISGIHPTRHFCTLVVNKPYPALAGALVSATVACWEEITVTWHTSQSQ